MATPAGSEPATCRLEGGCSIQLSYGVSSGKHIAAAAPGRQFEMSRKRFIQPLQGDSLGAAFFQWRFEPEWASRRPNADPLCAAESDAVDVIGG